MALENTTLEQTAATNLMTLALGVLGARMLHSVAELGIADRLRDGPRDSDALAAEAGVHPQAFYRLMRALSSMGYFTEKEDRQFALNAASDLLRSDTPGSVLHIVRHFGADWHVRAHADLLYSVRTGNPALERAYGEKLFDYLGHHPEQARLFDATMGRMSADAAAVVAATYDFSRFPCIVDVGGGNGELLSRLLGKFPTIRGVLFDTKDVVAPARARLSEAGDRLRIVAGDFFEQVPEGGDAYVLKNVVHDWDDESATRILSNCRRAIQRGGSVLLVEAIIGGPNETMFAKISDVGMLTIASGIERTQQQYADLFARAGLRLAAVSPTPSPYSVIEAVAA